MADDTVPLLTVLAVLAAGREQARVTALPQAPGAR